MISRKIVTDVDESSPERFGGLDDRLVVLSKSYDTIKFFFSSPIEDRSFLSNLYINKKLSASEIAQKYDHSKTFVLKLLKQFNIERRPHYDNGQKTFTPSYGYKDYHGKRCLDKEEQDVIQLILTLRSQDITLRTICDELTKKGITTRSMGKWHPYAIKRILDREQNKQSLCG